MPANAIDENGLTIQTAQEIIAEILDGAVDFPGMREIYGADINVDPNSPDGQMVNIIAQAKVDVLEMIQQVYNSFDPDKAIGVSLNSRCAINGIVRLPGTHTQQTVTVAATSAVTIQGLDTSPLTPFTISDSNGNKYVLLNTYAFGGAGTTDLAFEAVLLGPVSALPNTITTVVTITAGIASVNNASGPTLLGLNEETDYAFRIRRQNSVELPNIGYFDGLVAGLINTTGVQFAEVIENDTNAVDGSGVPAHGIWVIVAGGANADIARVIYIKRNAGCDMKGAVVVPVLRADGTYFNVKFDRPTAQPLWIEFSVVAIGSGSVDPVYIRQQLLSLLSYGINKPTDTTSIVALIRQIAPNASVSAEGISIDGVTYTSLLSPSAVNNQFTLSAPHIIINGTPG